MGLSVHFIFNTRFPTKLIPSICYFKKQYCKSYGRAISINNSVSEV
jgi:hypothetical protein